MLENFNQIAILVKTGSQSHWIVQLMSKQVAAEVIPIVNQSFSRQSARENGSGWPLSAQADALLLGVHAEQHRSNQAFVERHQSNYRL